MNPLDELTSLLPAAPESQELPRLHQHKAALLRVIAAGPWPQRAWRKRSVRRWLTPALASVAVAVVAVIAVAVPTLVGNSGGRGSATYQGSRSGHPGRVPAGPPTGSRLTATRHWSVAAASFGAVSVSIDLGSVTVVGHGTASQAAITATPRYQGQPPVITSQVVGGTLSVTARCPQDRHCQVQLTLEVPAAVALKVTSGQGDVRVVGVRGAVTARAGQGTITLDDLSGPVSARDELGAVNLSGLAGPVTASTSDGAITASDLAAQRVSLSSQRGRVSAAFSVAPTKVIASVQLGAVAIRVPATATYHVIASSQLGSSSVTVPQSAASQRLIEASSRLGSVTVTD